jgi:hypothetical protein
MPHRPVLYGSTILLCLHENSDSALTAPPSLKIVRSVVHQSIHVGILHRPATTSTASTEKEEESFLEQDLDRSLFTLVSGDGEVDAATQTRGIGNPVRFGGVVRLLHVMTNRFLCDSHQRASSDRMRLRASLESHSGVNVSSSRWRIFPQYKVRCEGEQVLAGDRFILRSLGTGGKLVVAPPHCSSIETSFMREMCSSLQPADHHDASGNAFHFRLFNSHSSPSSSSSLFSAGSFLQLYHGEEGAFVYAADRNGTAMFERTIEGHEQIRRDALDISVNTVFVVEGADPTNGGLVPFERPAFRLRNFASGMYLSGRPRGTACLSSVPDASTVVSFHQAADDKEPHVQHRSRLFLQFPLVTPALADAQGPGVWLGCSDEREEPPQADASETGVVSAAKLCQDDRLTETRCYASVDYRHALEAFAVSADQIRSINTVVAQISPLEYFNFTLSKGMRPTLLQTRKMALHWSILACSCTDSTNDDPLTREGLPIKAVQQRLIDRGVVTLCTTFLNCVRNAKTIGYDYCKREVAGDAVDEAGEGTAPEGNGSSPALSKEERSLVSSMQTLIRLVIRTLHNIAIGNPSTAAALSSAIPSLTPFVASSYGALICIREILRDNSETLLGELPGTLQRSNSSDLLEDVFAASTRFAHSARAAASPVRPVSQVGTLLQHFINKADEWPRGTINSFLLFLNVFCQCSGSPIYNAQAIIGEAFFQLAQDSDGSSARSPLFAVFLDESGQVFSTDFQGCLQENITGSAGAQSRKKRGKSPLGGRKANNKIGAPTPPPQPLLGIPEDLDSSPVTPRRAAVPLAELIFHASRTRSNARDGPLNCFVAQLSLMGHICLGGHMQNIQLCEKVFPAEAACKLLLQNKLVLPDDVRSALLNYLRSAVVEPRHDEVQERMVDRHLQSWSALSDRHSLQVSTQEVSSFSLFKISGVGNFFSSADEKKSEGDHADLIKSKRSRGSMVVTEALLVDENRQTMTRRVAMFAQEYLQMHCSIDPSNNGEADLVHSCLMLLSCMVKHQFVKSEDYVNWIKALTQIIDGRNDKVVRGPESSHDKEDEDKGFSAQRGAADKRFVYSETYLPVVRCKLLALDILAKLVEAVVWDRDMPVMLADFFRYFTHRQRMESKEDNDDDDNHGESPFVSSIADFRVGTADISVQSEGLYKQRRQLVDQPGGLVGGLLLQGVGAGFGAIASMGGALLDVGSALTNTITFGAFAGESQEPPLQYLTNLLDVLLDTCCYEYPSLVAASANMLITLLSYHTALLREAKAVTFFLNGDETVLYAKFAVLVDQLSQACTSLTQKGVYRVAGLQNIFAALSAIYEEIIRIANHDAIMCQNARSACRTLQFHVILTRNILCMLSNASTASGEAAPPGAAAGEGSPLMKQSSREVLARKILAMAYTCLDFVIGDHRGTAFAVFEDLAGFAEHLFLSPLSSSALTSSFEQSRTDPLRMFDDDASTLLFVLTRFFAELDDGISVDVSQAIPTIVAAVAKMRGDVRYPQLLSLMIDVHPSCRLAVLQSILANEEAAPGFIRSIDLFTGPLASGALFDQAMAASSGFTRTTSFSSRRDTYRKKSVLAAPRILEDAARTELSPTPSSTVFVTAAEECTNEAEEAADDSNIGGRKDTRTHDTVNVFTSPYMNLVAYHLQMIDLLCDLRPEVYEAGLLAEVRQALFLSQSESTLLEMLDELPHCELLESLVEISVNSEATKPPARPSRSSSCKKTAGRFPAYFLISYARLFTQFYINDSVFFNSDEHSVKPWRLVLDILHLMESIITSRHCRTFFQIETIRRLSVAQACRHSGELFMFLLGEFVVPVVANLSAKIPPQAQALPVDDVTASSMAFDEAQFAIYPIVSRTASLLLSLTSALLDFDGVDSSSRRSLFDVSQMTASSSLHAADVFGQEQIRVFGARSPGDIISRSTPLPPSSLVAADASVMITGSRLEDLRGALQTLASKELLQEEELILLGGFTHEGGEYSSCPKGRHENPAEGSLEEHAASPSLRVEMHHDDVRSPASLYRETKIRGAGKGGGGGIVNSADLNKAWVGFTNRLSRKWTNALRYGAPLTVDASEECNKTALFSNCAKYFVRRAGSGTKALQQMIQVLDSDAADLHVRNAIFNLVTEICQVDGADELCDATIVAKKIESIDDSVDASLLLTTEMTLSEKQTAISQWSSKDNHTSAVAPKALEEMSSHRALTIEAAMRCACAMLQGGNVQVQASILQWAKSLTDETFFVESRNKFSATIDMVKLRKSVLNIERKASQRFESSRSDGKKTGQKNQLDNLKRSQLRSRFDFSECTNLLRLVRSMVYGNYRPMQQYFLDQPDNRMSINVLEPLLALFFECVQAIDSELLPFTLDVMATIRALVGGNCQASQAYAASQNIGATFNFLFTASFPWLPREEKHKLLCAGVQTLQVVLDGLMDPDITQLFVGSLRLEPLAALMNQTYAEHLRQEEQKDQLIDLGDGAMNNVVTQGFGKLLSLGASLTGTLADSLLGSGGARKELEDGLNLACDIFIVFKNLFDVEELSLQSYRQRNGAGAKDVALLLDAVDHFVDKDGVTIREALRNSAALRPMLSKIATIEIVSEFGQVRRTSFRRLEITTANLRKAMRIDLLNNVDRRGDQAKVSDFFERSFSMINEMEHNEKIRRTPGLSFIYRYAPHLDFVALLLAFVINLFLLFSVSVWDYSVNRENIEEDRSIYAAFRGLALLSCVVQSALFVNFFVGPLTAYLQEEWARWEEERNKKAIDASKAALGVDKPLLERNAKDKLPFALWCYYTCMMIVRWTAIYPRLVFLVTVWLGYYVNPVCFVFQLYQVIEKSAQLQNVVLAVTRNKVPLAFTFLLWLLSGFCFSVIAYYVFSEKFDGSTGALSPYQQCDTLFRCSIIVFTTGVRFGPGITKGMGFPSFYGTNALGAAQLIYDVLYFLVMRVVILQVVFLHFRHLWCLTR